MEFSEIFLSEEFLAALVILCLIVVMSDKTGNRVKIVTAIISAIATIFIAFQSKFIGIDAITALYEDDPDHILFSVFEIVASVSFGIFLILAMVPGTMLLFFVIDRTRDRIKTNSLSVSLQDESKLFPGGVLYLDVKYTGRMYMGYFTADIITPFDEYSVKSKHYNSTKQSGTLWGRNNDTFGLKCEIPDNFKPDRCKVLIKAKCTMKIFGIFLPVQYTIQEQELECTICDVLSNTEEKLCAYVDEKIVSVNKRTDTLDEKMNKRFDVLEEKIEKLHDMILDEPLRSLKIRYAKGYITRDEFLWIKNDLL